MTKSNKPSNSAGRYNLVAESTHLPAEALAKAGSTVVFEYMPDKKRVAHYQSEAELAG